MSSDVSSMDIRLPMGLMFSIIGAIITIFGATHSGQAESLGINVDLWWGVVILIFGILMLIFGLKGSKKPARHNNT